MAAKEPKPPKMTVREINMQAAKEFVGGVDYGEDDECPYEFVQAEMANVLRSRFKLTRADIATTMGSTVSQVATMLKEYDLGRALGKIPTGLVIDPPAKDNTKDAILQEEEEKRKRSAITKEVKGILASDIFLSKLAESVALKLPTKTDLKEIDKLWRAGRAKASRNSLEIAMANMSDLHLCKVSEYHDFKRGMLANDNYIRKVISLTERQRSHCTVKTIHLNSLGDMTQGTANYPSQKWDTDRPAILQAEAMTEVLVKNVETLLVDFDEVVVNVRDGNHGYVEPKGRTTDPDIQNWEVMMGLSLKWAFRSNPRVTINLPTDWYNIIDVLGNKILLTHGHAIMGAGKYDGIVNAINGWSAVLPEFRYVVVGHFHRAATMPLPTRVGDTQRRVYINGTAIDHDDFLQKMGASPTPQWWLFFLNDKRITNEYLIDLYS